MADSEQERTEQATSKRRLDARKKGQVAQSSDLVAFSSFLVAVILISVSFQGNLNYSIRLLESSFSNELILETDVRSLASLLSRYAVEIGYRLFFFMFVIVASSVLTNLLQTGFLFLPDKIKPQLSRIDPFSNAQKVFSPETLFQLLLGLIKIMIVVVPAGVMLRLELKTLVSFPYGTPVQIGLFAVLFLRRLAFLLCGLLLLTGVFDYIVKRIKLERQLRMTQQELREELKEESGNPQIKGKIKTMRSSLLQKALEIQKTSPTSPISRFSETSQRNLDVEENKKKKTGR